MHNVNLETLERTAAAAAGDPAAARTQVELTGEWQVADGPQFRGRVPFPGGEVELIADFPPPLSGSGAHRARSRTASGAGSPPTR